MKLIKLSTGQYPYGLEDLKREHPKASFPAAIGYITPSDFDCVEVVTDSPPEDFNPETHYIKEADYPELIDGVWRLAIEVLPIPAPIPTPDWISFNEAVSFDSNMIDYEFTANQIHPSIVGKKDLAYSIINSSGIDNFAVAFPLFCLIAGVTQEDRNGWADMAELFNLPSDFVDVVRGEQNA